MRAPLLLTARLMVRLTAGLGGSVVGMAIQAHVPNFLGQYGPQQSAVLGISGKQLNGVSDAASPRALDAALLQGART